MSLDARIRDAIQESVKEVGQSSDLARKLIAWFEAVTSGNEDINDPAAADRHLEILYAETSAEREDGDEDGDKS